MLFKREVVSTPLLKVNAPLVKVFHDISLYGDGTRENPLRVNTLSSYHRVGTGSPEGVVSAPIGTLYSRTDGDVNTTLYVKVSGSGNTGWVAK